MDALDDDDDAGDIIKKGTEGGLYFKTETERG